MIEGRQEDFLTPYPIAGLRAIRRRYADSPLIEAGDPADGPGSYIGAVGTGANAPQDNFGRFGAK